MYVCYVYIDVHKHIYIYCVCIYVYMCVYAYVMYTCTYDGPKWPKHVFLGLLCKYAQSRKNCRTHIFEKLKKVNRKLQKMSGNCRKSYFSHHFADLLRGFVIVW